LEQNRLGRGVGKKLQPEGYGGKENLKLKSLGQKDVTWGRADISSLRRPAGKKRKNTLSKAKTLGG